MTTLNQIVLRGIKKSFEDLHLDAKIYWISPTSLWNSTTITMLIRVLVLKSKKNNISWLLMLKCILEFPLRRHEIPHPWQWLSEWDKVVQPHANQRLEFHNQLDKIQWFFIVFTWTITFSTPRLTMKFHNHDNSNQSGKN